MGFFDRFRGKKKRDKDSALEGKKTIQEYLQEEERQGAQRRVEIQEAYKAGSMEECVAYVEDTCKQIREAALRIQEDKEEYDSVGNTLNDVVLIETIDGKDRDELTTAADRIVQANEERIHFQNTPRRLPDAQYQRFQELDEKDVDKIVQTLQKDEEYAQALINDMEKLEGEKASIRYEVNTAQEHVKICQRLIQWVMVLLCTGIVFYIIILIVFHERYDTFLYIVLGIIGIFLAASFAVYQNSTRKFRLEKRKLNKVIRFLNTTKLRYVNISNSISYRYQKYNVNSAYEMNHLWGLYLEEKRQRESYRGSSQELHEAESELIGILNEYQLISPRIWVNYAKAILDSKEMVEVRHDLNGRRQKLREAMEYNKNIMKNAEEQIKKFAKLNPNYAANILNIVKENSAYPTVEEQNLQLKNKKR